MWFCGSLGLMLFVMGLGGFGVWKCDCMDFFAYLFQYSQEVMCD